MSDDNERSVASAGSVGEPVAFAVMQPDSYVVVHTRHAAVVRREMCGGGKIVPLYRQPQDGVVRLPPLDQNGAPGWNAAIGAVREALADAGVDWDTE